MVGYSSGLVAWIGWKVGLLQKVLYMENNYFVGKLSQVYTYTVGSACLFCVSMVLLLFEE